MRGPHVWTMAKTGEVSVATSCRECSWAWAQPLSLDVSKAEIDKALDEAVGAFDAHECRGDSARTMIGRVMDEVFKPRG